VLLQPLKRVGSVEIRAQRFTARRTDIDGATAVVFAATRRGHDGQNGVDWLAAIEFRLDQLNLPVKTAITGDNEKRDPFVFGRRA
jgi:hypothetical protein